MKKYRVIDGPALTQACQLIPNRFLFDFEFPLRYRETPPALSGDLRDWTDAELLPRLGDLDGSPEFGAVWACWNELGLYVACRVTQKRRPLECDPKRFWTSDHLRLCTDMRDARAARRATRFCQQFFFMPTGGGPKHDRPVGGTTKFKRARDDAPLISSQLLEVAGNVGRSGYSLSAHIPAACLSGFDPEQHARIGLYYMLEDCDHGQQHLTIGDDLLWYVDPSTWPTAVLTR